eukprot:s13885_g1.t1
MLSRPNGELTRAGQYYYQLIGRPPPSRQYDRNQPLIREGPNDYIMLRGGAKKLLRSLQPNGNYHLTKLGKSFFKDRWVDWVASVLAQLGNPEPNDIILELSDKTYYLDATREWTFSQQAMQVVDDQVVVDTVLDQPLGTLRDVSYQLFCGDEILESAFEQRPDKLCVARQLAELMRLPLQEGRLLDKFEPVLKEQRAVAFTSWNGGRGPGQIPGAHDHFYADLEQVRRELLAEGHWPKVVMRSMSEWRCLRLRVQAWMSRLGLPYRGQRLAGAASEVFLHLLKALQDPPGSRQAVLAEQDHQCKLCAAPITAATCELDHIVPVQQSFSAQAQKLQALCL